MKRNRIIPSPQYCRHWLDALAESARVIGEWPADGLFWPRLASVTFTNALLLKENILAVKDTDWLPPVREIETFAVGHFRESVAGHFASGTPLPKALRLGFISGLESLPRAFTPRETNSDPETKGRWLVGLALRQGLAGKPVVPDLGDRLKRVLPHCCSSDHFLISRLFSWRLGKVEDLTPLAPMHDFIIWRYRHSEAEAGIMPWLVAQFEELGTLREPIWDLGRWINAGWRAGVPLTARSDYRDIFETAPRENICLTHSLYRELAGTLSPQPRFDEVAAGTLRYLGQYGYKRSGPGHNAFRCLNAFDYTLWMRLAHHGLVPVVPPAAALETTNHGQCGKPGLS
jgi:hypothetical protein